MACRSCRERAEALARSAKALKAGDTETAKKELSFVATTAARDATTALRSATVAARSRLMGRRR